MINSYDLWQDTVLPIDSTLMRAINRLNDVAIKIVFVVDSEGRLAGTITDGDLRRGLMRGLTMEDPVQEIANPRPLVVPEGAGDDMVRALMQANKVLQVPVVNAVGKMVGLHLWDSLDTFSAHDHIMIIMAGGKGTRLLPHTETCPKPMVPVGNKPMMQHIIERARGQGFSHFILSLNYLGGIVRDHFGDGSAYDVRVDYVDEDEPLGTAGALSLLKPLPEKPFVVTNGDVLTDINYRDLIDFRERNDANGVMAVRQHEWTNPYGVVHLEGMSITGFLEKPTTRSYINAGVYAFSPAVLDHLEWHRHCDMPTLFDRLREAGHRTIAYPMHEPWLDVGRPGDLKLADAALRSGFAQGEA